MNNVRVWPMLRPPLRNIGIGGRRTAIKCIAKLMLSVVVMLPFLLCSSAFASRHALLIGNEHYESVGKLQNAAADAESMGAALSAANYRVTLRKNRSLKQMKDDIRNFAGTLKSGDEVVFFFAGHGVQIASMNYLLPTDVRSDSEGQVRDDALALSSALEVLREVKPALTIAIIDACRDNPFKNNSRAIGGRGLAGVGGATGQMVIYSAGEGQQALDRLSATDPVKNGLFTRVFVKEMKRPGLTVDQIARNVRNTVAALAQKQNHEQVPAIYDQILGQFYFYEASTSLRTSAGEDDSASSALAVELTYWNTVKDSRNVAELQGYLIQYPEGKFASIAKVRLASLQARTPEIPMTPSVKSPLVPMPSVATSLAKPKTSQFLSKRGIEALSENKKWTFLQLQDNTHYLWDIRSGGLIFVNNIEGRRNDSGRWSINDANQLCVKWNSSWRGYLAETDRCVSVMESGNEWFLYDSADLSKVYATMKAVN